MKRLAMIWTILVIAVLASLAVEPQFFYTVPLDISGVSTSATSAVTNGGPWNGEVAYLNIALSKASNVTVTVSTRSGTAGPARILYSGTSNATNLLLYSCVGLHTNATAVAAYRPFPLLGDALVLSATSSNAGVNVEGMVGVIRH